MGSAIAIADLDRFKSTAVPSSYPSNFRTFYSPIDDVHGALRAVLEAAQHSIVLAMYGYDDDELAAIIDSALLNPRVYVQVSLDRSQAGGAKEAGLLEKYRNEMTGNSVAIGTSEKGAIMHRKMVVVDGLWRISGSTNWSTSGETLQDNELTVTFDPVACAEARSVLDVEHDHMLKQLAAAAQKASGATAAPSLPAQPRGSASGRRRPSRSVNSGT